MKTQTKVQHTPKPDDAMTVGEPCFGCGEYPRWNGAQHCPKCARCWDHSIKQIRRMLLSHDALLEAAKDWLEWMDARGMDPEQRNAVAKAIALAEGKVRP